MAPVDQEIKRMAERNDDQSAEQNSDPLATPDAFKDTGLSGNTHQ